MIITYKHPELVSFEDLTQETYQTQMDKFIQLSQENTLLKAKLFGRSCERLAQHLEGETLLPGLEDLIDSPEEDNELQDEEEQSTEPTTRKKKKAKTPHGRSKLPESLPRIIEEHFPDGLTREDIESDPDLVIIGDETSEVLGCKPIEFFVTRHIRYKIARPNKPEAGILIAPPAFKPISKGKADSSVLANIIADKYLYHQPLHRQEVRYKRMGLPLARSTLCDWIIKVSKILVPIYEVMKVQLLKSKYIHTDDTPVRLVDPNGGTKQSRVWVYAGGELFPYVAYLFSENRKAEHVEAYLAKYKGSVHCDAYSGYDFLFSKETNNKRDCLEIACWSHARRYFHRAYDIGEVHAWEILTLIGLLFKVERRADRLNLKGSERKKFRNRFTPGALDDIRDWLNTTGAQALPKSLTGKAVTYLNNQWDALTNFQVDGDLSLTNNYAERLLRMIALGRNNWQFFATETGGEAAVILYSIIQTCILNDVDPWLYLTDTLNRVETHSASNLVPHKWKIEFQEEAKRKYLPCKP